MAEGRLESMAATTGGWALAGHRGQRRSTSESLESITESEPQWLSCASMSSGNSSPLPRPPPAGRPDLLGQNGKRSPMDIVIPSFVEEDEVGQYLADLLHELATPTDNAGCPTICGLTLLLTAGRFDAGSAPGSESGPPSPLLRLA